MESGPGERDVPAADVDAALLTALFAAVDVGVYAVDDEGTVIACNPAAEQLLGYPPGTLIGVNAHRTLHPPALDRATTPLHRPYPDDTASGKRTSGDRAALLRADGTPLQVSWTAAPLPTATEHGEGAVVVFHDATAQRVREGRRAERYAHSETMREQAEYDLAETTWLGELTLAMTSTLNADEALHRLVRQLVPRLADTALIDLAGGGTQRRVAAAHHAAGLLPTGLSGELLSEHPAHQAAVARVVRGGGTQYLENLAATAGDEADLLDVADAREALVLPLRLHGTTFGALTLTRAPASPPFNEADRALAEEVSRRISLGLDNARLHAAQVDIAAALQRALLTDLPEVPGIELAAHYRPAQHAAEVGGDWYDAFLLDEGDLVVVIGDVTGHDIQAATRMSELRSMLRALAVDRPEETPGQILRRLDTAQARLTPAPDSATAIFARLYQSASGAWDAAWSVAGHPPPLLITKGGAATYLTGAHSMLLGLRPTAERPTAHTRLPNGATLLLYTDGLVESRTRSIDDGMTRLRQHAATHRHLPLDELCAKLAEHLGDTRDDITLIAVRTPTG